MLRVLDRNNRRLCSGALLSLLLIAGATCAQVAVTPGETATSSTAAGGATKEQRKSLTRGERTLKRTQMGIWWERDRNLTKALQLSDEQKAAMDALLLAYLTEAMAAGERAEGDHQTLVAAAAQPDAEAFASGLTLMEEKAVAQVRLQQKMIRDVLALLNPDQLKSMTEAGPLYLGRLWLDSEFRPYRFRDQKKGRERGERGRPPRDKKPLDEAGKEGGN